MTTVGTLTWHPPKSLKDRGITKKGATWGIEAVPHVVIRLKRIFPKVDTYRNGMLLLPDTIEMARELEWVTTRFPLDMSADVAERLANGSRQHQDRVSAIDDILGGRAGQLTLTLGDPGMTPRDYQEQFVQLVAQVNRVLLGDATGVGKTITSALCFALPDALPALVAMPTHLPPQWTRKMNELWPTLKVHTLKGTRPYSLIDTKDARGRYPDILLTPYSRIAGWSPALAGQVRTVIFDEVQELRTGRHTDKGAGAARISEEATYVIGQSATPAHNYGGEFWNVFDILAPDTLGSKDEFVREWCTHWGTKVIIRDPKAFGTYLRSEGLMLARSRKDVGLELGDDPIVEVQIVSSDVRALNSVAESISQIAQMIVAPDTDRRERFTAGGQLDMRLRQATGVAKAPHVADYVELLLESEAKVVLYGWHREVYDIWLDRLVEFNPAMYTGSETPVQKEKSLERFLRPADDPTAARILIVSLASGAGLDGIQDVCSAVVFGELDWSPKVHTQAVDRVHRPGQTEPVLVVYCVSENGSDPVIAETLDLKAQNTDPVMDPTLPASELLPKNDGSRMRELAKAWLAEHDPRALEAALAEETHA